MGNIKIKRSMIQDEILVCPYCMSETSHERLECCGESSNHFETAIVTQDEAFLESEIEIIED